MSEFGTAPIEQRDIRSAAKSFKRDRDSGEKWSTGTRPLAGVRINHRGDIDAIVDDGERALKEKVRPGKPLTNPPHKSHVNKTPKPTNHYEKGVYSNIASHRMVRKVDALVDANDHTSSPLSRSLLELLPQHANNTATSIQTAVRDQESGILYSYDNAGASPGVKGRAVGLDSLVEMAEKKWVMEQTDKILKGEYEVLDAQGETTVLSAKKGKKSPKQKAVKTMPALVKDVDVKEEDGFELI